MFGDNWLDIATITIRMLRITGMFRNETIPHRQILT